MPKYFFASEKINPWETILEIDIEADRNAIKNVIFPLHIENKIYFFLTGRKAATIVIIKWYIRAVTKLTW